ncbi:putative 2OG-Fe(II) oxygenase family oxidoreductase [Microdochium trichocladiopsis]|uniref:2OG-Fe(II) oxygenase family oxidoreductase n=1 Tax=Microdochium trichocladiopsis TaxID=1682393 RepID=A0A9P9BUN5_9PEZI|nr:putative 2OG-Fe(II) oxygenase family oxidoreductase [Microdochium trichocladiopsis]KAH7041156.1 putative 2OG-Fe(II) oxygenase family oxidoreductase [Microdochium trichocladiopsis]
MAVGLAESPSRGLAPMPTLNAAKLLSRDADESQRLLQACKVYGFFYLNLETPPTGFMVKAWRDVLSFMDDYFDLPDATKMLDAHDSDITGYEPCGTSTGAKPGHVDHYESLKVSLEQCLSGVEANLPAAIAKNKELFTSFVQGAHELTLSMLSCLALAMGLPPGVNKIEAAHDTSRASTSTMSMFRYPAQTEEEARNAGGHNQHTDIGTLTFLLCQQPGLQVLSPQLNKWLDVEPRPGHAIINVGDSLRYLSDQQLFSAVHCVLPHEGRQLQHRHSIAFFLRPADDAEYTDSRGAKITAREWHNLKFDHFRASHAEQANNVILTGGMEKAGIHRAHDSSSAGQTVAA